MNWIQKNRLQLKELLAAPKIVVAPGCGDVVTARLVELLKLPAIHASGSVAHRTSGYADAGILTMNEMVNRVSALAGGVDLPIIADADTGFGGLANVVRTVKEYEWAGASAIHIEDQLTPKRPIHGGYSGGFISLNEMVGKIKAALDTRLDNNFIVIARCDIDDWNQKQERVMACIEAGADGAWLSVRDTNKMEILSKASGKPMFGVLPRSMNLDQYQSAGASCAVIPGALQLAALCNQRLLLESLKSRGSCAEFLSEIDHIDEMREFYNNQGFEELRLAEKYYGAKQTT